MSDDPVLPPSTQPSLEILGQTPKYLVDGLFPTNEVHLLSGPSGVGKTRWMVPMIHDWYHGLQVLGQPSHPQQFGYLVCDRTIDSTSETMRSMGYDPKQFLLKSMMQRGSRKGEDPEIDDIDRLFPRHIRVIFVEAVGIFVPKGKLNDYNSVWKLYEKFNHLIEKRKNLTVIATTHTPKARENEGLINVREKSIGSAAWGACAGTMMDMSFADPKDATNAERVFTILPRNSTCQSITLTFDSRGRLSLPVEDMTADFLLDTGLAKLPYESEIPTPTLYTLGTSYKLNERTVERWIKRKLSDGYLERLRRGLYKRVRPT